MNRPLNRPLRKGADSSPVIESINNHTIRMLDALFETSVVSATLQPQGLEATPADPNATVLGLRPQPSTLNPKAIMAGAHPDCTRGEPEALNASFAPGTPAGYEIGHSSSAMRRVPTPQRETPGAWNDALYLNQLLATPS